MDFIDICDEMPIAINESNAKHYAELFRPYQLVIIDPLIAFYSGDENSNSQARAFMNCLNIIARKNNQSILITHHSTKSNVNETSRSRGDSAFVDSVRLAYELDFIGDPENLDNSTRLIAIKKIT